MSVVAVAGGLGNLGRLITEALFENGKHEVYVISRKVSFSLVIACMTEISIIPVHLI